MLDSMVRAVEVTISGDVQGVSFRAYAAREAVRLELAGWVQNAPDGGVIGHFEGPSEAVDDMLSWCREGSPSAHVHQVEVREVEPVQSGRFSVRYEPS